MIDTSYFMQKNDMTAHLEPIYARLRELEKSSQTPLAVGGW